MTIGKKITKRLVESISGKKDQEILLWDSEIKGFGVRVFSTNRKTYFVQYRNQFNRTRRKKIGVHGIITAEQAREEAKSILGDVAKGKDPSRDFQNYKNKKTMRDLVEKYFEVHARPNKKFESYIEDKRKIDHVILSRFQNMKLEEITTLELQILHRDLKETPYKANRVRALLSKMFSLAVQWKWLDVNPINGVPKYQEQKRTRWLNEEELQRLWNALEAYHNQNVSNVIRLLVLTGSRRNEVLGASWDQFDLERGVWTKPSHMTKQNKMEHLPLSSQVVDLLKAMKKEPLSPYLFPGKISGKSLQSIKKAWKTIREAAGLLDVRLHDLRHTHASHLVSGGLSLSIVGKLLGHTQASTTQRYAHLADESLRNAAELFGNKIDKLIGK
ncbi:MAG TPA: tyrosine-type recombinase/integrase [Alphaproteobacteria bacterium]|nr:tyrosine-type recombinase/integrase [Alphaproteobacteria bacterium]HQS94648.1 tyrosine-type recombinase/integrase [Alphaproteobacteria bacterium]